MSDQSSLDGLSEHGHSGRRSRGRKHRAAFGLKNRHRRRYRGNDPYNYEEKYPEDPAYEELSPNARVWRMYLDESAIFDADIVNESTDSVDVLLVFAGLFSAVVSTFVVLASDSMKIDFAQVTASLSYEMVLLQRAFMEGQSSDSIPSSPNPSTIALSITPSALCVSALWYASLVASLSTALVAVLVKQWLHQYTNLPSGTAKHRSHVRQFRYAGFQAWKVLLIIGLLPVLMHLSLALFLIGLVIFLSRTATPIAWMIGTMLSIVYVAYVVSHILPMVYPRCPYRTPLSNIVLAAHVRSVQLVRHITRKFGMGMRNTTRDSLTSISSSSTIPSTSLLKDVEARLVDRDSVDLSMDALHWLHSMSSNPTVQSIVIESVGALPLSSRSNPKAQALFGVDSAMYSTFVQFLKMTLHPTEWGRRPDSGLESKAARLLRYDLHVGSPQLRVRVRVERSDTLEFAAAALSSRSGSWNGSSESFWILPFLTDVFTMSSPPAFPLPVWLRLIENVTRGRHFLHNQTFSVAFGSSLITSLSQAMQSTLHRDENGTVVFADAIGFYPHFRAQVIDILLPFFEEHNQLIYNPLVSPSLRMALAIVDYCTFGLLRRQSFIPHHSDATMVSGGDYDHCADDPDGTTASVYTLINHSLQCIHLLLRCSDASDRDISAILTFIARFAYQSQLFNQIDYPDERVVANRSIIIHIYTRVVTHAFDAVDIPPHTFAALWHPLSIMMDCMFGGRQTVLSSQWKLDFHDLYPVLVVGLENAAGPAYDVFVRNGLLERIIQEPMQGMWAEILLAYVSGLVKATCRAKEMGTIPGMSVADYQRYMGYLHQPDNLMAACSIIAWTPSGSSVCAGHNNIVEQHISNLANLWPDCVSWEECRRRLRCDPLTRRQHNDVYIRRDGELCSLGLEDDDILTRLLEVTELLDDIFDEVDTPGSPTTVAIPPSLELRESKRVSMRRRLSQTLGLTCIKPVDSKV